MGLTFERCDLTHADARALIEELNAELMERYPEPGANHFSLDPDEVAAGKGLFLIVRRDGAAIGCGAVRMLDGETAELKRMFTRPAARGLGIGKKLLVALEDEARRLGARRLVLETGTRQTEAMALYAGSGFHPIPPWGEYLASASTSTCMAKDLDPADGG